MLGRPKFKANGVEYLVLPSKATSQSIKFEKDGNTWYVPLVSGTAGSYSTENNINFKLGYLKVGNKYGAIDTESIPSISIIHQPYHIRNGRIYSINPLVFSINDDNNNKMNVVLSSRELYQGSLRPYEDKTWSNKGNGILTFSGDIHTTGTSPQIKANITATNTKNGVCSKDITGMNTDSKSSSQFGHRLYWIDKDNTYFTGTQSTSDDVIHLTGHHGSGIPYHYFTGFSSGDEYKRVKWDIYDSNGVSIKDKWLEKCRAISCTIEKFNANGSWVDITTRNAPSFLYGVKISEGWIPNGEYDLVIVVDDIPNPTIVHDYSIHIVMDDPDNPYSVGFGVQHTRNLLIVSGSSPTVGKTYTNGSSTVWAKSITTNNGVVTSFTAIPEEDISFTIDSVISSALYPGSNGGSGPGHAGGTVYTCKVH